MLRSALSGGGTALGGYGRNSALLLARSNGSASPSPVARTRRSRTCAQPAIDVGCPSAPCCCQLAFSSLPSHNTKQHGLQPVPEQPPSPSVGEQPAPAPAAVRRPPARVSTRDDSDDWPEFLAFAVQASGRRRTTPAQCCDVGDHANSADHPATGDTSRADTSKVDSSREATSRAGTSRRPLLRTTSSSTTRLPPALPRLATTSRPPRATSPRPARPSSTTSPPRALLLVSCAARNGS